MTLVHYDAHSDYYGADWSCTLAISTDLEARCYLDPGQAALRSYHKHHPNVHCPITVGVGDSNQGPVSFLAAEGIKQARRFPQGRSERSFPFMLS